MRRRNFIALLGSAAAAWPLAARAQQAAQRRIIGVLGTATPSGWSQWTSAFVQRFRELGWIEGRNVLVEYRWAEGREERFAEIAAEFVPNEGGRYRHLGRRGPRDDACDIAHSDSAKVLMRRRLAITSGSPGTYSASA